MSDLKRVGIIVGEARTNEFYFVTDTKDYPAKWEYLVVYSQEDVNGKLQEVPVIAQVEGIVMVSEALSLRDDLEVVMRILEADIHDVRALGRARILGYYNKDLKQVLQPRRAVMPGKQVYIAPRELLKEFYSFSESEGLYVGHLITRPDVPVYLSVRGFRRHLAIIAQTGAGKSYLAGVLIEELLEKGATIIVLDPHSDYVMLPFTRDGGMYKFSDRITIFRSKASTGRFRTLERVMPFEIAFADLSLDEICNLAGIRIDAVRQREAVRRAVEVLSGKRYMPEDLLKELQEPTWEDHDPKLIESAKTAARYIQSLARLGIFGYSTTDILQILKPQHVAVIDLSGLRDDSMNYIAASILSKVYKAASMNEYDFPAFIVVEEAHKFVPADKETYASPIINKIAAEGRKFGIFLILITQRPSKVHDDSLSQCNSQIIMRLTNPKDQSAVSKSSERISQDLLNDLPSLNPGEAVVVGEVVNVPVMIKVRSRITREGGADIDIVKKLEEAREMVKMDNMLDKEMDQRQPFRGEFEVI